MDWFDQYLDGMGEYKTTISPADTHQWGPAKPSKQQQSMIQDSMAFDIQQRNLIREARQELEENTQGPGAMSEHDVAIGIGADPGSPTVQLVTAAASVPGAPTIYVVDCPGNEPCQTLYIEFSAPESDGGSAITDYEYSIDDGENWLSMGRDLGGEFYAHGEAGSIAGQELFVRVRAVNAAGAGAPSALWPEFVCRSCVPTAPNSFAASNGGDCQLAVSYSEPEYPNGTITHYEMTIDDESTWTNIGSNGLDEEYLFSYPQGDGPRSMAVRVRAVNATGAGDATDMIPVTVTGCAEV